MKLLAKPLKPLDESFPTVNYRMEFIRCLLGFPPRAFANKIGTKEESIIPVLKHENAPTLRMIDDMLKVFPFISAAWLKLGTGDYNKSRLTLKEILAEYQFVERSGATYGGDYDYGLVDRIKLIRMDTGLSQSMFAVAVGSTKDKIVHLENYKAKPDISLIKNLITDLGACADWILFDKGPRYKDGVPVHKMIGDGASKTRFKERKKSVA